MKKYQRGMGMFGILIVCIVVIFGAVGGMKVVPAYLEYYNIKKAVKSIVQSGQASKGTPAEIRELFERRRAIDDFESVTGKDLDITKQGGDVVISFAYPRKIQLFANVNLLIEFAGSSNQL
jgi:uncharacterized protein DUF4845